MQNLVNREEDIWIRPWNIEKFDNLYERDERFFSFSFSMFLIAVSISSLLFSSFSKSGTQFLNFWIISELVEKIQKHEPKIIQYCLNKISFIV